MYQLSKYIVITDIINPEEIHQLQKRLLYSTRNGTSLLISDEIYKSLLSNGGRFIESGYLKQLIDSHVLVEKEEDEFSIVIAENHKSNNNTLGVVLHTTANCQFGCGYCGQSHEKKNIDKLVVDKVINYIDQKLQTEKFLHLFVVWHGSEPLMSFEDLRKISQQLIKIAKKYNVSYHSNIITNGLILKTSILE